MGASVHADAFALGSLLIFTLVLLHQMTLHPLSNRNFQGERAMKIEREGTMEIEFRRKGREKEGAMGIKL